MTLSKFETKFFSFRIEMFIRIHNNGKCGDRKILKQTFSAFNAFRRFSRGL